MDFKTKYKYHRKNSQDCHEIAKEEYFISTGNGGSINIILMPERDVAIKVIPWENFPNRKIRPNSSELEIAFYKFFTQKFLLKDKTPHIVGYYSDQKCDNIKKFLMDVKKNLKSNSKTKKDTCPTYQDLLLKKFNNDEKIICDLILRYEMKMISSKFNVIIMEKCNLDLSEFLNFHYNHFRSNKSVEIMNNFVHNIYSILFHIIFTLAVIKDEYTGFIHGDFFVRNILLLYNPDFELTDFVAYHYKKKIFYLPANGFSAKINDFGLSIIDHKLLPDDFKISRDRNMYDRMYVDPYSEKVDIFNFLYDLYEGGPVGNNISLKSFMKNNPKKANLMIPIYDLLNRFMDLKVIDKIVENNKNLLGNTWDISGLPILEATVKKPKEYLKGKIFDELLSLPEGAKVIKHYNK